MSAAVLHCAALAHGQAATTRVYSLPADTLGGADCAAVRVVPDGTGQLLVIVPLVLGDPGGVNSLPFNFSS